MAPGNIGGGGNVCLEGLRSHKALGRKRPSGRDDLGSRAGKDCGSRYVLRRKIASGGFGDVFQATPKSSSPPQTPAALKRYRTGSVKSVGICASAVREIANLRAIGEHPHIVTLRDVGFASQRPFAVMDLYPMNLMEAAAVFSLQERKERAPTVALHLALALAHLDSLCIVHRDIKLENVLCRLGVPGEGFRVSLCDLGGSRYGGSRGDRAISPNACLTILAPEVLAGKGVNHKSDVFCAAVCVAEFVRMVPVLPSDLASPSALALETAVPCLTDCFESDPNRRPSASQLVLSLETLALSSKSALETDPPGEHPLCKGRPAPETSSGCFPPGFFPGPVPSGKVFSAGLGETLAVLPASLQRCLDRATRALAGLGEKDQMSSRCLAALVAACYRADRHREHDPELTVAAAALLLGKYAEEVGTDEVLTVLLGSAREQLTLAERARVAATEWSLFRSIDFHLLPYCRFADEEPAHPPSKLV